MRPPGNSRSCKAPPCSGRLWTRSWKPSDPTTTWCCSATAERAILAYQKRALADLSDEEKAQIEFVVIGNVSRPNGGLNTRLLGFSAPIVEFPFGPSMPTDTGIETTDIAMKWDIIADAPLYLTNPWR